VKLARLTLIVMIVAVCLAQGAHAAHLATDLVLPSIGRSGGLNDSMWYTTLWVHNPGAQAAVVEISLLRRDQANPTPNTVTITLAAGATATYKDLLWDLFGLEEVSGALHVTSDGEVMASARIFNNPAGDLSASLGQFFAGIPAALSIANGESTDVPGITHPADQSFRCNWGLVETAGGTAQVRLTLVDGDGTTLGERTVTLGPYQPMQQSIGLFANGVTVDGGCLHVEVLSGDGRVMAFASMIANTSGDPSTLEMEYRLPSAGSGDGDITAVVAGDGLSGGGQDGDVTLDVSTGAGLEIADDEVAVADGGVTQSKLSATGGDAGQVLTTDGTALVWQDLDDASMELPFEGAAAGSDPAFKVTNTTAVALHGEGGTTGVHGVGGQMGGYFADSDGSGYARLGNADRGVEGYGNESGGFFGDLNSSAKAWVALGDDGIHARGNNMGGYFKDHNSSGEANVAFGDIGISASGSEMGGSFEDSDGSGYARLGRNDRGIAAAGTETGGHFTCTNSSGRAYVAYGDAGIWAWGDSFGAYFWDDNDSGLARIGYGDRGIEATGSEMGGFFGDSDNSGYAYVGWGDSGVRGYGNHSGAFFKDLDDSGKAMIGIGDRGIEAWGDEVAGYFEETDSSTYVKIAGARVGVLANGQNYDFYADGPGTNYGPFTGGHEVRLADRSGDGLEPGLIVAVTGRAERRINGDGTVSLSSTLPTVELARRANDPRVFGVVVAKQPLHEDHWYPASAGERFATVNALGEGRVWVTDVNGPVRAGDLVTTSAVPGYGQRQDDDLFHAYTLGKVIEDVDWSRAETVAAPDGRVVRIALVAVVYTSG